MEEKVSGAIAREDESFCRSVVDEHFGIVKVRTEKHKIDVINFRLISIIGFIC